MNLNFIGKTPGESHYQPGLTISIRSEITNCQVFGIRKTSYRASAKTNRTVMPIKKNAGLTLLELMISLAIVGIIVSVSVPGYSGFRETQRLTGAAENLYGFLQQARSESLARNVPVFVNFAADGSETWMYGMSSVASACDISIKTPATSGACVLVIDNGNGVTDAADFVLMRVSNEDSPGVSMTVSNFSSGMSQIQFNPVRGMASSGQIDLHTENGSRLRVKISLLGRVSICAPDASVARYSSTGC
jgi:type IV fimbrial biogenesis protein FimT